MYKYCCTNCGYVYNPFLWDIEQEIPAKTFFEDLDIRYYCPSCGEDKNSFYPISETIQEIDDIDNISTMEEIHIPFFYEKKGKLIINIWSEDYPFLEDENHFIEYVWIFDEDWEEIAIEILPDTNKEIIFNIEDLDYYEVRSSCNLHWVWKWIKLYQK